MLPHRGCGNFQQEQLKLTLSGAPDAVGEASRDVDGTFGTTADCNLHLLGGFQGYICGAGNRLWTSLDTLFFFEDR